MANAVRFNWHINYVCNYRCPYCFYYGSWHKFSGDNNGFTVGEWIDAWQRVYKKFGSVAIEITGGEPFLYPGFDTLLASLLQKHHVQITTNLSYDLRLLSQLLNSVDCSRLNLILSFHPTFAPLGSFLEKARLLKEKKVAAVVNYVAYPTQFRQIDYFKNSFEKEGFCFLAVPFRGEYGGITYPEGYSAEEKQHLQKLAVDLKVSEKDARETHREWLDSQLVHKESRGRMCRAGQVYAHIDSKGLLYRCNSSVLLKDSSIGDFFDEDFKLLTAAEPCLVRTCHCEAKWLIEEAPVVKETDEKIIPSKAPVAVTQEIKKRRLGRTGILIAEVGMGGHTYDTKGGIAKHGPDVRKNIFQAALDLGLNYFDACDCEELTSTINTLNSLKARDRCVIAYGDNVEGDRITNADEKFIREHVERHLRTLKTDRIDILRVLDWSIADYARKMKARVEEEIEQISLIIDKLKKEGKVRFSCFSTHLQDTLEPLAGKAKVGELFEVLQTRFNFLESGPANKIIPYAKTHDMGVVVIKPFRKGTLLNKYCGDPSDPSYADLIAEDNKLFEGLPHKEKGLAYALLKYILSNNDVSVVIPGVATLEQLTENARVSMEG
jgi:aryl-alcohol dehydrogenase-like predicted oxidoreductase/MoaA/NifB/PqqE/SkfB family radical SAM enzyme